MYAARRSERIPLSVEYEFRGTFAAFVEFLTHRRQIEVFGKIDIIESDDGDIFRNPYAPYLCELYNAGGDDVARCEDAVG